MPASIPYLWVIIPGVTATIVGFYVSRKDGIGAAVADFLKAFFLVLLFEGIISVFLSSLIPQKFTAMESKSYTELALTSLGNQNSLHGDLFLGTGVINSVEQYRYRYRDGDGTRRGTIDANLDILVVEQNRTDGLMKTIETSTWKINCVDLPGHEFMRRLIPWKAGCGTDGRPSTATSYKFYVPKGSVDSAIHIN